MSEYNRSAYIMDHPAEGRRLADKVDAPGWMQRYYASYIDRSAAVLSVGCGPGHFLDAIATQYPHVGVTGVDVSAARVGDARKRNERHQNVSVIQGDIHNLPIDSDSFDFVEARFLFEYLKDKKQASAELARVCRPGGVVCLQDLDGQLVFYYPEDDRIQRLQDVLLQLGHTGFDVFVGRKLFALAKNAGLVDLDVRIDSYHVIAGAIGAFDFDLWRRKLAIAEPIIAQACGTETAREVISGFLDYLQDENTLTYSMLFTVTGRKLGR
ncbi:Methyltransf_25 domain-containing protein [Azospirillaceae bacterium]